MTAETKNVRITGGGFAILPNDTTWPLYDGDLAYELRYGRDVLTQVQRLRLASIVEAYGTLYMISRERREYAVRHLRVARQLERAPRASAGSPETPTDA